MSLGEKGRVDYLDLLIKTLMDHEKKLSEIIGRLEDICEQLSEILGRDEESGRETSASYI